MSIFDDIANQINKAVKVIQTAAVPKFTMTPLVPPYRGGLPQQQAAPPATGRRRDAYTDLEELRRRRTPANVPYAPPSQVPPYLQKPTTSGQMPAETVQDFIKRQQRQGIVNTPAQAVAKATGTVPPIRPNETLPQYIQRTQHPAIPILTPSQAVAKANELRINRSRQTVEMFKDIDARARLGINWNAGKGKYAAPQTPDQLAASHQANLLAQPDEYAAIERIRLNRGAPDTSLQPDITTDLGAAPAGTGYGGYGYPSGWPTYDQAAQPLWWYGLMTWNF